MPTKQKIVYGIFGIALIIFGIGGIVYVQNSNSTTISNKPSILDSITQNSSQINQVILSSSSSQLSSIETKLEIKNAKLEIKNLDELQVDVVKKSNNPIQVCFRNKDKCTDKDKITTYFDGIESTTTYTAKNSDTLRLIPNTASIIDPDRKDQL